MKNDICPIPFQNLEIYISGDVYTCCPNWNNRYSIGNIFKHSIEEVWNSDKAVELRRRVMNNDYSLCNIDSCFFLKEHLFATDDVINFQAVMTDYPVLIKFAYDPECNIKCKICRDKIWRLTDEELEILDSKIDTFFLPILKHANLLMINSAGDPFGSRHSRKVIKQAAHKYPKLRFIFHTNGILCNEKNFKELGIKVSEKRIKEILISLHAATAQTYGKMVSNGEILFPKIIDNLAFLQKKRIKTHLNFVVTPDNYKEIPAFINLAERFSAIPNFWEYRYENCFYDNKENLYIYRENHPLYKDLVKVLKYPKVRYWKKNFSPVLSSLIDTPINQVVST